MTGWILCLIPHIRDAFFKSSQNKHNIQLNNVIKTFSAESAENSYMEILIRSGVHIQILIKRMIPLKAINLPVTVKISVMVPVIYGIINTHYHPPKFLVL